MPSDLLSISVALTMCFAVLFAKITSNQFIAAMRRRIATAQQDRGKVMRVLKMSNAQRRVAEKNQESLEIKKTKLSKRINKAKRDLDAIETEQRHRDQLRTTMRGKLIRS